MKQQRSRSQKIEEKPNHSILAELSHSFCGILHASPRRVLFADLGFLKSGADVVCATRVRSTPAYSPGLGGRSGADSPHGAMRTAASVSGRNAFHCLRAFNSANSEALGAEVLQKLEQRTGLTV